MGASGLWLGATWLGRRQALGLRRLGLSPRLLGRRSRLGLGRMGLSPRLFGIQRLLSAAPGVDRLGLGAKLGECLRLQRIWRMGLVSLAAHERRRFFFATV